MTEPAAPACKSRARAPTPPPSSRLSSVLAGVHADPDSAGHSTGDLDRHGILRGFGPTAKESERVVSRVRVRNRRDPACDLGVSNRQGSRPRHRRSAVGGDEVAVPDLHRSSVRRSKALLGCAPAAAEADAFRDLAGENKPGGAFGSAADTDGVLRRTRRFSVNSAAAAKRTPSGILRWKAQAGRLVVCGQGLLPYSRDGGSGSNAMRPRSGHLRGSSQLKAHASGLPICG